MWEGRQQALFAFADTTQIRAAELQVMQSAKLATLGEMASAIAHELNQPLAVIKMASTNARRLVESGAPQDAVVAKLERIEGQIDRAKRITDQVRRYARTPSSIDTTFPLRSAIELAAGFVSEQLRAAGIRLDLDLHLPSELVVGGEQTMFEQTIVNLLVNARDAFDGKEFPEGEKRVRLAGMVEGEEIVITVCDNAGGIAPQVLPHLFEAFTTTKTADKGTGLGLSLSRTVVGNMEGTIGAANIEGGARFTIRLPLSSGRSHREVA
jgi:C4-dicarboxylate-specific signal transduction histidine kinase